ncbi:unnamed protein product [Urochloa decumbens]|uniref:Phytocyanin domain-containing protein n=1 Tax=Urochloa decumbens TaxID=240449 RepID=A0ABC9F0L4_9POAL
MAYSRLVWLLVAVAMAAAAALPSPASAEYILVGDATGWNLSYPVGWPEGKTFKVGDSLVFDYPKGQFTVTEVDSEAFRECYRQGNTLNEWTSGHDVVPLDKPGRRWFFSSLANHCDLGLKLVVDVAGAAPVAPAPSPRPHPTAPAPSPRPHPTAPANPPVVSPAPTTTPDDPPSPDKSSAALNHYKIGEVVARAVVVAGAVVAAVFL